MYIALYQINHKCHKWYLSSLYLIYPNRAPPENSTELLALDPLLHVEAGSGWSAGYQAAMQAAALGVTLAIAIVGGLITGTVDLEILPRVNFS